MNIEQLAQWWRIFHEEGSPIEVRILSKGGRQKTWSGYFKDMDNLINQLRPFDDRDVNVYFLLNKPNDAVYSKKQREALMENVTTTADPDIVRRRWVLIDLDPKRPSDTSSSNEELNAAHMKAVRIFQYLKNQGFNDPVVAMSGNGYHLLYPCDFMPSAETDDIVRRFLLSVSMLFDDEKADSLITRDGSTIDVDEKVFNRARICKLYGTMSRKGYNSPDRPHRESMIVKAPEEIRPVKVEYFKKIADLYPEEQQRETRQWNGEKFDIHDFLNKHGIRYHEVRVTGGSKFILDHCVFNPEHKGKDAVIFQRDNGALSYVCLHNSCSQYHWRDFRLMFEPDAYDKKDFHQFVEKRQYYAPAQPPGPVEENDEKGKKWKQMSEIDWVDVNQLVSIPTGYYALDRKIVGLIMGDVTVVSGTSGSGKTSWIDCICLNAVQKGYKVAVWSGELQDFRFKGWMMQIAAGKNYVEQKYNTENYWYAPQDVSERISAWLEGKMFLYNNNYGNKWSQLFSDIKNIVENERVQLVVIDNLMAMNLDSSGDKYDKQTAFINDIKDYAKKSNIHVILVCHPRKEMGFLRKESVSGSADLTNLCDNLFIIHRINNDFMTRAKEFIRKDEFNYITSAENGFGSVVEVCKNRALGIIDHYVGMVYETESRRYKNSMAESVKYGWDDSSLQREEDIEQLIDNNIITTDDSLPF